jgi:hypothetical protein
MNVDSAAVFLAGTILYCFGLIVILIAVIVANNLIHKFWKSFGWNLTPALWDQQPRFISPEEAEKIAPTFESKK